MHSELFYIKETLYLTIAGICCKQEMDKLNVKLINCIKQNHIKDIVINLEDLTYIDIDSFNMLEEIL